MAFPEILAPAGSFESLTAALRCGADAVYIGGKTYSARQSAANFSLNEIKQAAELCHLYGSKLYLAVNTLILDSELQGFGEFIALAARAGVDACIVQDVGAAHIIRKTVPDMPLHGSTQMTIHTAEGAIWAKKHGFCRVVAAREMSREEIKSLLNLGIEIEQFVHGALCMSVSGQCYMSALIGSRSANRGRCAQACRLPFSACGNKNNCALSLKDLSLVPHMDKLIADGVSSLKIEGRMKRPEYVAAAVTALRQARDGLKPDMETLRSVFSRSGFTDGYYTGLRKDIFGMRQKEDVTAAKNVLPELQELYRKQSHPVSLDIDVKLTSNAPITITGTDDSMNTVTVCGDIPVPAIKKPADKEFLVRQLSKLGDTVYFLRELSCTCDGVSTLPASALNALRRELTQKLDKLRIAANTPVYTVNEHTYSAEKKFHLPAAPALRFRVNTAKQLDALDMRDDETCIIPIELAEKLQPDSRFIISAPRFVPDEKSLADKLRFLRDMGYSRLMCENPAHIRIGKALEFRLCGGMDLHTTNSASAAIYANEDMEDILLSPELTLKQAKAVCSGVPLGMYAYGRIPVMLLRCCPIKNEVGCKKCTGSITDRTNRKFPVLCRKDYTELLNSVPIWMADKLPEMKGMGYILIDVTNESPQMTRDISLAYRCGTDIKPDHITRGLLYRGIEPLEKKHEN